MHSFDSHSDRYCLQRLPFHPRDDDVYRNGVADFEEVLQFAETGVHSVDSADISTTCWMYSGMEEQLGGFSNNLETASSGFTVEEEQFMLHKGGLMVSGGGGGRNSDQYKERDELRGVVHQERLIAGDSALTQSKGIAGAFEADHARWRGEHQGLIDNLRSALSYNRNDKELNSLVGAVVSHYGELLRIKKAGARSDMFHIISGVWESPAERCLMWLGGFRPSDLLKVAEKEIEVESEEQLVGICNVQQSCQQTEKALSQGMDTLRHSLLLSLTHHSSPNLLDYANQMAAAMTDMEKIESFLNQADLLRLYTLQQLQGILTAHQAARALIAIHDYKSRLRALSSLWNNWANINAK